MEPLRAILDNSAPIFIIGGVLLLLGVILGKFTRRFRDLPRTAQLRKSVGVLSAVLGLYVIVGAFTVVEDTFDWTHDETQGLEEARESKKPTVIDFYATWCGACVELDKFTFSDPQVRSRLEDFVKIKLDFSRSSGQVEELKKKYGIVGLPVVLFLDSEGKPLKRLEKFVGPKEFLKILDEIEQKLTNILPHSASISNQSRVYDSMCDKAHAPSRNWLSYLEGAIIIVFIALIVAFTHKGETQSNAPPISQAQEFISQGDQDFAKKDLGRAALAYWEAIRIFESAKRDDTESTHGLDNELFHANLRVAEIYLHSSWIEDARNRLEHAARIQPNRVEVHLLRGKLERDDGERLSTANEFLAAVEMDPTHAEARYLLGLLYQRNKQYEDAIAHYTTAIENDAELVELPFESQPIGLQARLQLARTYRRMLQDYRFIDRELSAHRKPPRLVKWRRPP